MISKSVVAGVLAAFVVQTLRLLQLRIFPFDQGPIGGPFVWLWPSLMLASAVFAIAIQAFLRKKKAGPEDYHGLADMMIHIHQSASPDSPIRWLVRAAISSLFALFSGNVGSEGACDGADLCRFSARTAALGKMV